MANRKKRRPIQREPIGNTKSEILIYIANNDNATITDIRRYLRNERNIRNIKVIRKHLSDLVLHNIISIKKAERRGLSDIYYLEKSFSSFKTSFNFINEFYKPSFLGTKYAKDVISSDDFFVYGIINIGKEIFSELLKLKDENYFNSIIEKAKRNGEDISGKEIKELIEKTKKNLHEEDSNEFLDFLMTTKPEDIFSTLGNLNEEKPIYPVIKILVNAIFPEEQRKETIEILSTSPSATDYFLNLKSVDRLYLFMIVIRFYLSSIFKDAKKIPLLSEISKDKSKLQDNLTSYITGVLSIQNISNDNPILTILRSYFLVDAFNGNLVNNEYSNSVLKEILLPKAKEMSLPKEVQ